MTAEAVRLALARVKRFPLTVAANSDLAVKDYPTALQQAREWLSEHADHRVMG